MQLVTLISWFVLFYFSKQVLKEIAPENINIGLLLIAIYPFFGISFIGYPIADLPSHAAFAACIYYFLKSDNKKFILTFIVCSFMHKAIWPSLFLLLLLSLFSKNIKIRMSFLCVLPLVFYYLTIFLSNDYSGLESLGVLRNLSSNMALDETGFYPFKGIFESLFIGSYFSAIKACLTFIVIFAAFFLLWRSIQERNYLFILIILPTIVLALIINELTSLGVLRHSKFLIIPFCYFLYAYPKLSRALNETYFIFIALLLCSSQIIFHWYNFIYYPNI